MAEKPFKQLCDELHEAVEKLPPSIAFTDSDGYRWKSYNSGETFRRMGEAAMQLNQAFNEFGVVLAKQFGPTLDALAKFSAEFEIIDTRPRWQRWVDKVRGK